MSTPTRQDLRNLYLQRSKHASYQLVHPLVAPHMPAGDGLPAGKLEVERQAYFERTLTLKDARVLDIGANTGYFSFGALQSGASHVTCYEGNLDHAAFVAYAAEMAGLADRLTMHACYFDFQQPFDQSIDLLIDAPFDVTYCLNVLHHLGDDFGDHALDMSAARTQMLRCLNDLAAITRTLMLQLGFNWKGDIRYPLFEGGEKAALIDFVTGGSAAHWRLDEVTVPDPVSRIYEPVSAANLPRNNRIGEFMNRPLFKLRSRLLDG